MCRAIFWGQSLTRRPCCAESERERKAGETYEALKGLFPGVKGRLLELCDVTHKRYNTAVTVVMGKNMVCQPFPRAWAWYA